MLKFRSLVYYNSRSLVRLYRESIMRKSTLKRIVLRAHMHPLKTKILSDGRKYRVHHRAQKGEHDGFVFSSSFFTLLPFIPRLSLYHSISIRAPKEIQFS